MKYIKGLVSIIIPTRGDRNIRPTLASIKNQTYKKFEIIQINDKAKKGASWARNEGEKKAKGEFVLFLDDDIILKKNFLAEMEKALDQNEGVSYAYCHYERKGIFNDISKAYPFNEERLRQWNYISTMSLLRHKDFLPWDETIKRFQDWDLWLTLLEKGKTGILIDKVLFEAFYTDEGITNISPQEVRDFSDKIKIKHKLIEELLKEKNQEIDNLKNIVEEYNRIREKINKLPLPGSVVKLIKKILNG